MLAFLKSVFAKPKRLDSLVVTVYSREGCTCCDKAMAILEDYQARHHFQINIVDIDTDPALVDLYGLEVPVIAVDGKVRFKGKIKTVLLDRLIEAAPASE